MDTDQAICTIRPLYEYELETIRPTLKIVANVQLNNEPDMKAHIQGGALQFDGFGLNVTCVQNSH